MLLTITTTHQPATDLGYLLSKHPARVQSFALAFGQARVFYPEASVERCTAALLLEIDPLSLVRRPAGESALEPYVNDRPYVASSFLSVAIAQVFGSALAGTSRDRPALAETAIPLLANLAVVPSRGGEALLRRLFEPLGYAVSANRHILDEHFPEWGESRYFTLQLEGTTRLRDLLAHLYVLIPVLDDEKHYWVGEAEVEKLLRHGEGWLSGHPERELIVKRYLKYRGYLTRAALARLSEEDAPDPDAEEVEHATDEVAVEARVGLHAQRLGTVAAVLKQSGARRVVDLGCGEGRLIEVLLRDKTFDEIVGLDVSVRALDMARERLHLERLPATQVARVKLLHGALTYRDERLGGFDAAAVVEVIEHLDPARLAAFERVLFECARPGTIVVTTPNAEYNVKWESLPADKFRHKDHRFEWTRAEFESWANGVAERFGYAVRFLPVGPEDAVLGAPTQMGVFTVRS